MLLLIVVESNNKRKTTKYVRALKQKTTNFFRIVVFKILLNKMFTQKQKKLYVILNLHKIKWYISMYPLKYSLTKLKFS